MKSIFLFIKAVINKNKTSLITIFMLMILAVLVINLSFVLAFDYKENFKRYQEKLNGENISELYAYTNPRDLNWVLNYLNNEEDIKEYEITKSYTAVTSVPYDSGDLSFYFSFIEYQDAIDKEIGKLEILESNGSLDDLDGVYVSYCFKAGSGYKLNDDITFTINGKKFTYKIQGFYNAVATGTPNCQDSTVVCSENVIEDIKSVISIKSFRLSAIVADGLDPVTTEAKIIRNIDALSDSLFFLDGTTSTRLSSSRFITETIIEALLKIAAIIIAFILLVLIGTSTFSFIKENTKNLGVLKAIGFEGKTLFVSLEILFLIMCLISIVIGIPLSYLVFYPINDLLIVQTAVPYEVTFILMPLIITSAILIVSVTVVVLLSGYSINNIEPILAIREVKETYSGKSIIKLEKTKLSVNLAISLKKAFSSIKKNIVIIVMAILVGFAASVACYMHQNVLNNIDGLVDVIYGERGDVSLTILSDETSTNNMKQKLDNNNNVESYYIYNNTVINVLDHGILNCYVTDGYDYFSNEALLYEGKFPYNPDEIALNVFILKKYGLNIGDNITIIKGDNSHDYKIVGTVQMALNCGYDAIMDISGLRLINNPDRLTYHINLSDYGKVNEFIESFNSELYVISIIDEAGTIKALTNTYIKTIKSCVFAIIAISVTLLVFVVFLLVKSELDKNRKEYGILMAIGYTTSNLRTQLTMSFMPPLVISLVVGLITSKIFMGDVFSMFVSGIGIMTIGKPLEYYYLGISFAAIVLVACMFIYILSSKIKKITPHHLFVNE